MHTEQLYTEAELAIYYDEMKRTLTLDVDEMRRTGTWAKKPIVDVSPENKEIVEKIFEYEYEKEGRKLGLGQYVPYNEEIVQSESEKEWNKYLERFKPKPKPSVPDGPKEGN